MRGRPRIGGMHNVKVALCSREIPVETTQQFTKDRKWWRVNEIDLTTFLGFCVIFIVLSRCDPLTAL